MKELDIQWYKGVKDTTGLLFSFAKSLGTAVKYSPYQEFAEDIIATSGFAFRMWVDSKELSPSVMCLWNLEKQKAWVENGGLTCNYIESHLGQAENIEKSQKEAVDQIKASIDQGIGAIVYNIVGSEWGLITGYEEDKEILHTLSITGIKDKMPYDLLGAGEIPLLSVLTITGKTEIAQKELIEKTLKLAAAHLRGEEDSPDITGGLQAYEVLLHFLEIDLEARLDWNMEYYLGTYAGLKYFAYQFFKKYQVEKLEELYQKIYDSWQLAFDLKRANEGVNDTLRSRLIDILTKAYVAEKAAVTEMESYRSLPDS